MIQQQEHPPCIFQIQLPKPTSSLSTIFNQLRLLSKQRLQTNEQNQNETQLDEIKGLKFIAMKLAKLFMKNRKLPYNEISKILVNNFASEKKDQRNIKRRVYDAINVLVSAGVFIKRNNFIYMLDKAKLKQNTSERIQKFQYQTKLTQRNIAKKILIRQNLVKKHKMIKKLFDRNMSFQQVLMSGPGNQLQLKKQFKKSKVQLRKSTTQLIKSTALLRNSAVLKRIKVEQNEQKYKKQKQQQKIISLLSNEITLKKIQSPNIFILFDAKQVQKVKSVQKFITFDCNFQVQILLPHKRQFNQDNTNQLNQDKQNPLVKSQFKMDIQQNNSDMKFIKNRLNTLLQFLQLISLDTK